MISFLEANPMCYFSVSSSYSLGHEKIFLEINAQWDLAICLTRIFFSINYMSPFCAINKLRHKYTSYTPSEKNEGNIF